MKRHVYLLRGSSGAGKSTFANILLGSLWGNEGPTNDKTICCADDYCYDSEGNYNWSPKTVKENHQKCRDKFSLAIESGCANIIVANTNTKPFEFEFYEKLAKENGYQFFSIVMENRHGNQNVHSVPQEVVRNQAKNIQNNLKLC